MNTCHVVDLRHHHIEYLKPQTLPETRPIKIQKIVTKALAAVSTVSLGSSVYAYKFMIAKASLVILTFKISAVVFALSLFTSLALSWHLKKRLDQRIEGFHQLTNLGYETFKHRFVPKFILKEEAFVLLNEDVKRHSYQSFIDLHGKEPFRDLILSEESLNHLKESYLLRIKEFSYRDFSLDAKPEFFAHDPFILSHFAQIKALKFEQRMPLNETEKNDLVACMLHLFNPDQVAFFKLKVLELCGSYAPLDFFRDFKELFLNRVLAPHDVSCFGFTVGSYLQAGLRGISTERLLNDQTLGIAYLEAADKDLQDKLAIENYIHDRAEDFITLSTPYRSLAFMTTPHHLAALNQASRDFTSAKSLYELELARVIQEFEDLQKAHKSHFDKTCQRKKTELRLLEISDNVRLKKMAHKLANEHLILLKEAAVERATKIKKLQIKLSFCKKRLLELNALHSGGLLQSQTKTRLASQLQAELEKKASFLRSITPTEDASLKSTKLKRKIELECLIKEHESALIEEPSLLASKSFLETTPTCGLIQAQESVRQLQAIDAKLIQLASSKLELKTLQKELALLTDLLSRPILIEPDTSGFDAVIKDLQRSLSLWDQQQEELRALQKEKLDLEQKLQRLGPESLISPDTVESLAQEVSVMEKRQELDRAKEHEARVLEVFSAFEAHQLDVLKAQESELAARLVSAKDSAKEKLAEATFRIVQTFKARPSAPLL